ncbi:MAG: hypothetical protein IPL70_11230 [Uliginosibacterium sp.]|nr:hypothetical protein [Uliginosibacterium sp.]
MKQVQHKESINPAYVRDSTIEFSNDTYKGQAVVVLTHTAPQANYVTGSGTVAASVNRSFLHVTPVGIERIAHSYRSPSGNNSDSEYTPPASRLARLRPGETFSWEHIETETRWSADSPTPTTKDYRWVGTGEFLGFEDVTLGDGTVIKNACKLKEKDLSKGETAAYDLYWLLRGCSASSRSPTPRQAR